MQEGFVAPYAAIVGKVISELRRVNGMEQTALAAALGVAQSTWSRIENGGSALSIDQLRKVAEALKTTPSQILAQADQVAEKIAAEQVTVVSERPAKDDTGVKLLFGAALGLLVLRAMRK
ncbi:MAG: helix-turn-helix transcriptional regulator [Magnetospirillum gryphiswaldense]|nr:helix-turn-helix transcriptional regulator [Magnetospirillum gryphiswaldense]